MWQDLSTVSVDEIIKSSVMRSLQIEGEWIGNPSDSTFGIALKLMWNGSIFGYNVINFLEDKR